MVRLISLIVLLATWWLISQFVEPQTLPGPDRVLGVIAAQMRSGDIFFQLGVTLARVLAAFTVAMAAGTAIGLLMGSSKARRPARRSLAHCVAEPSGAGDYRPCVYLGRAH
jgi:ABC-type nitrate/sulfonate/bicarbonate transport system, permease component